MGTVTKNSYLYVSKLLLLLLVFVSTGLALSFSISYSFSILQGRDIGSLGVGEGMGIFNLFLKQLVATILGLAGIFYLVKTPTPLLRKLSNLFILLATIAMVYTSVAGTEINGSRRWLVFAGVSFQTGDFARLAMILYLSNIFTQYHTVMTQETDNKTVMICSRRLLLRFLCAVSIYGGALYVQKDYSSLIISAVVIFSIVLVSDMPTRWKLSCLMLFMVAFGVIIISNPHRMSRIVVFLNPEEDPLGRGFQLRQSLEIIRSGGWFGTGAGSNMLNILGLPYFNNDFVFSIIVGEYGIIGAITVLMFFWALCWQGYKLSHRLFVVNKFYYYLLIANIVNLVISTVLHVSVTIGVIPTAGLNLPFYSSGGSSMLTSLLSYGMILRAAVVLYYHDKKQRDTREERIVIDGR